MKTKLSIISLILIFAILLGLVGCGEVEVPQGNSSASQVSSAPLDSEGAKEKEDIEENKPAKLLSTELTSGITGVTPATRETDELFVENQMRLAVELFEAINNQAENKNVLISPLSIQLALTMAANGAEGETKAQLEALLGGEIAIEELNEYLYTYVNNLPNDKGYLLNVANSIWFRDTERFAVKDEFLATNKGYYDAEAYKGPFDNTTLSDINNWVSNKTDGMIDQIVECIEENDIMFIINALLLDAEWSEKYSEYSVGNGKFTTEDGVEQDAEMMYSMEGRYIETENATGFEKSYKYDKYSFVALLPKEGVSVRELMSGLDASALLSTLENISYESVYTVLPKFEVDYRLEMMDVLMGLGVTDMFEDDLADFSALGEYQNKNIVVGDVIHKTAISVCENGTKAAAVTSVQLDAGSSPIEPKKVILNRPFVYMIIDNETNLPIFMGALTSIN